MASSSKKKSFTKDRLNSEAPVGIANLQSPFLSAAHNTIWPYDASVNKSNEPTVFTAAANVICGRLSGAYTLSSTGEGVEQHAGDKATDSKQSTFLITETERGIHACLETVAAIPENGPPLHNLSVPSYDLPRVRNELYREWLDYISANRASPLQYPHHVIHINTRHMVSASSVNSSPHQGCAIRQIATVLHHLLASHLRSCNKQPQTAENEADGRVPWRVLTSLLGSSVYNRRFEGPCVEQKDVTFGMAEPSGRSTSGETELKEDSEGSAAKSAVSSRGLRTNVNLKDCPPHRDDAFTLFSSVDAVHINVCIGQEFYKLCVMDRRKRHLRSVASLAADLELLYSHYLSLDKTDVLPNVSPEVQQDTKNLKNFFAHMTSLVDEVAFDVRRRLRVSSEVNAYTLDSLETGLCTLVLRVDNTPCESDCSGNKSAEVSQWLHSVCSLEVSLDHPEQWTMRLQAMAVSLQAGIEWVKNALAQPTAVAHTELTSSEEATPESGDSPENTDHRATGQKGMYGSLDVSIPVDTRGNVEQLELWLPEKHRVPLRPYPGPVWNRGEAQHPLPDVLRCACTLKDFCICILRVTARWKRQEHPPFPSSTIRRWPRIVIAVQPPRGGAPSLIAMNTPAVKHFYEVLAAPPRLFSLDAQRSLEDEAATQVAATLNLIWHATSPVRSSREDDSAAGWCFPEPKMIATDPTPPVDVFLSFAVLPRQGGLSSNAVGGNSLLSGIFSDLGVPSTLAVSCTAQQVAAEAHICASQSTLVDAVVWANTPAAAPHVSDFTTDLFSCMQEYCRPSTGLRMK